MNYTAETLQIALAPRPVRFFASTGSTNTVAMQWLMSGAPGGAVVIADEQTAGRGRHGRQWHTPPGTAIAVSVIVRVSSQLLGRISLAGAMAVLDVLDTLGVEDSALKWPNDVLVQGRKLSGVLAEAAWNGDQLQGIVLGIGMNVRNTVDPSMLTNAAIALETVVDHPLDRVALLSALLLQLEHHLSTLDSTAFLPACKVRMPMLGAPVSVAYGAEQLHGIAEDLDETGALVVRTADKLLIPVHAGEVTLGNYGETT